MFSKRFIFLVLGFSFFTICAQAQMDTNYVELWGMPKGHTELSYMQYLNQKKVTPCMVDLKKFGYKEGIVAGVDGLRLVILRSNPVYSFSPPARKRKVYPPQKVIDLLYYGIDNEEINFVKNNFFSFVNKDSADINQTIAMYKQYGIKIAKNKVYERFDLIKSLDSTDKDSCLSFLKLTAEPRMKSAALLGYVAQAKSKADLLAIFPFVLDYTVGDDASNYLTTYFSRQKLEASDWDRYHNMFVRSLNAPDPFKTMRLMRLYQQEKHCKRYAQQILKEGSTTIVEILKSRRKELTELRTETAKFLTYLTDQNLGQDYAAWLKYIASTSGNTAMAKL